MWIAVVIIRDINSNVWESHLIRRLRLDYKELQRLINVMHMLYKNVAEKCSAWIWVAEMACKSEWWS